MAGKDRFARNVQSQFSTGRLTAFGKKQCLDFARLLLISAGLATVQGCIKTIETRGYVMESVQTGQLQEGTTTKEEVRTRLGSPSSVSSFGREIWYYIGTKVEQVPFREPKIIKQDVVEVAFDDKGIVTGVTRYNLEDMRNIAFSKDATSTSGNKVTLAEQFLGNLGRFNPKETESRD